MANKTPARTMPRRRGWLVLTAATTAVTFLLTVVALMRDQRVPRSAITSMAPGVTPRSTVVAAPRFSAPELPAHPVSAELAPRPSIALSVHNQHRLDRIEGNVQNETGRPLTVVLVGKDRDGDITDEKLINLQPGAESFFGTDDGMALVAGGTVVARVAGEADKEIKIAL